MNYIVQVPLYLQRGDKAYYLTSSSSVSNGSSDSSGSSGSSGSSDSSGRDGGERQGTRAVDECGRVVAVVETKNSFYFILFYFILFYFILFSILFFLQDPDQIFTGERSSQSILELGTGAHATNSRLVHVYSHILFPCCGVFSVVLVLPFSTEHASLSWYCFY